MFRLEFCLLIIICFISYLYISSADNSSPLHKVFSYILAVMFVHLIFDMITIYTVNHLDSVPIILNDTGDTPGSGSAAAFGCSASAWRIS